MEVTGQGTGETINESYERELRVVVNLARTAGAAALQYYGGPLRVEYKGSLDEPVTKADHASNDVIMRGLREAFPDDGILSEESVDTERRLSRRRVWMVDPLDGTKGFIAGNGDFAVQIGLTLDGESVFGVVYQPVPDVLYWAARGRGAWVVRRESPPEQLRVSDEQEIIRMRLAASRAHRSARMDRIVRALGITEEIKRDSVGIKVGLIVERQCHLYIHLSPGTKQWDTCVPEAILTEDGGRMTDIWGEPIHYNSLDRSNDIVFVTTNSAALLHFYVSISMLLLNVASTSADDRG